MPNQEWARLHIEVTEILQTYADRGVFRGFSAGAASASKASFRMVWHHDRTFEMLFDSRRRTMRFPVVLPGVPAGSAMYREFREYLHSRQASDLPEHRRVDPARALLRCNNRDGAVSVAITSLDGDFEYTTRKLIHTVHEIFLGFLHDGPYYEYLVEQFGLDPDRY